MTVILARHGQTEFNRDKRILGRVDSALTEEGRRSARELGSSLARKLNGDPLSLVLHSPLGRAAATAGILVQELGVEPSPRPGLAELSAGEWEGLHRDEVLRPGDVLRPGWDSRPPGGEGYADAEARLAPVVAELRKRGGTSLVVGHFAINRVFLKLFLGLEEKAVLGADVPHRVLYLLEEGRPVRWLNVQGDQGEGLLPWDPFSPGLESR